MTSTSRRSFLGHIWAAAWLQAEPAQGAVPPQERFKYSGNPSAPIHLAVYTDFQCASCRLLYTETIPALRDGYIKSGKVFMAHRDFPLPQHQWSRLAARYANAAGRLGYYDTVVDHLFAEQPAWAVSGNIGPVVARLLPATDFRVVESAVRQDPSLDALLTEDIRQARIDGITATPSIHVEAGSLRQAIGGPVPFPVLSRYLEPLLSGSGRHK